jgi:hypothetical protein
MIISINERVDVYKYHILGLVRWSLRLAFSRVSYCIMGQARERTYFRA